MMMRDFIWDFLRKEVDTYSRVMIPHIQQIQYKTLKYPREQKLMRDQRIMYRPLLIVRNYQMFLFQSTHRFQSLQ